MHCSCISFNVNVCVLSWYLRMGLTEINSRPSCCSMPFYQMPQVADIQRHQLTFWQGSLQDTRMSNSASHTICNCALPAPGLPQHCSRAKPHYSLTQDQIQGQCHENRQKVVMLWQTSLSRLQINRQHAPLNVIVQSGVSPCKPKVRNSRRVFFHNF